MRHTSKTTMQYMRVLLFLAVFSGYPTVAATEEVFMTCEALGTSGYEIALDLTQSTVTYTVNSNGNAFKHDAILTADMLIWKSIDENMEIQFAVDRKDLTFKSTIFLYGEFLKESIGQCNLVDGKKRLF